MNIGWVAMEICLGFYTSLIPAPKKYKAAFLTNCASKHRLYLTFEGYDGPQPSGDGRAPRRPVLPLTTRGIHQLAEILPEWNG